MIRRTFLIAAAVVAVVPIAALSQQQPLPVVHAFPDARFVTIMRHPEQALASHLSLFHSVWRLHSPNLSHDSPTSHAFARLGFAWYRHLFAFGQKTDPKRYYCLDYRELTRDPMAEVEKLYAHFGWTMSGVCRARDREVGLGCLPRGVRGPPAPLPTSRHGILVGGWEGERAGPDSARLT